MSTSDSTFSSSSSCSFWNTTTALIAAVVATSDYVSPNKPTDCCGMVDDSRSSNKGTSSYSFNNNNSNEKDIDNGDGGDRGDGGGQSRDGNRQGGVNAYWKDVFSDSSKLIPNFGTTPNAATHDSRYNEKREASFSTIDFSSSAAASSSNQSILPVDLDVLPSQVVSSTSDAMWMLAPPLSSVLEKEFAIANTLEEFGLGDHDGDDQLPYEFWFDKLEVVPDSNISNSTMNVPTNTTTHKRKGKRKSTWDVNGGEYVDPAEDSQDYSKSDGLVYSKDPHANGLKLDGEPLDEEKVKEGRWYLHATPEANLFDRTLTNLEPHSFDLEGGIMAQGLKPMVQKGKKSKKPIRGVWAVPGGRAPWTIAHLVRTHKEALKKSGGKVALIMIYADDDRIKNFIPFRPGGKWSESCHPAYSREEIPVYPKDVFIVDIKELPMFLKQTKVRMDLIPLRTDAQKKATYDLWYHHKGGKEKQAAWHHEWSYKNGGKKYHADRYYNGGGKEKQTEQYHEQGGKEKRAERHAAKSNRPRRSPRCTDTSLGPNGVFQCRFDTLPHIRLPKKGDQPRCALHKWAGKIKNQLLKTDPEELGAHAALVRQQQQQQSLQSAAASSSSSSAPLLGWTGGTVLQGNNGGGGGCGTPSSSPLSSTLSSSSLSTLSSTLSSSTFGNNNLCTNDNILVDAKMINESQKALIESMKRSIASRKLVEIFATTSRK
ncbi:hypothetical protein FRACYDRAFT_239700 [Fragilariopsis cylindrus CCMP1102]|uniref:Uncharacterized protein n=1 Tax=Fragilariopsis cylindrus CCMP1102 TaxID=635003 RepID=A0A1E7FA54_9STRA|nr:hypothetical protein FRACYDRAFT_239700 [Fragilariopsis cylindrus CCMP1102]|eukprot:OEU15019.1 hypothetical protein FRACYDRAFT_239700 [Fragilariopsis cylindrus CCMP1102]